jgi:hypothetical protein
VPLIPATATIRSCAFVVVTNAAVTEQCKCPPLPDPGVGAASMEVGSAPLYSPAIHIAMDALPETLAVMVKVPAVVCATGALN